MNRIRAAAKSTECEKRELNENKRVKEAMIIASHNDYYVNYGIRGQKRANLSLINGLNKINTTFKGYFPCIGF